MSKFTRKMQLQHAHPTLETIEDRTVPSSFRPVTEVGNNQDHPTLGTAGTDLLRLSPVAYADGISTPSQPNTLSPRLISNNLNNQSDPIFSFADQLGSPQSQSLSDFAYVWGQFIDHDMDLTPTTSGQSFNIPADTRTFPNGNGGTQTDPMGVEGFTRSTFDPKTGTSTSNPRQQVNVNTSFLDLSQVYGSTQVVADALRVVEPGGALGAKLKTSPGDLLPLDNTTYFTPAQITALNMANDAQQVPQSQLFAAGDVRANENIELTAIQTLFVRNHNRLVDELSAMNPASFGFTSWTDENLYQEARKLNIAEEEIITYTAFLPAILGPNALTPYSGYNDEVNPGIATEFSTVAFRFGHSLLSNSVGRVNNDGTSIKDVNSNGAAVNLVEDFFRPDLINPNGVTVNLIDRNGNADPHTSSTVGAILKADASNTANEMDLQTIDEVRSLLFGIPNAPGTDLIARDIQRARDDGIGTYNQLRIAFGEQPVTSYAQISSDPAVQAAFKNTYGTLPNGQDNVNAIDPLEGMFAEDHVTGGDVGPTIRAILANQFERLRDGDRFFYLNESFTAAEATLIQQGNTLAKVIEANTSITNLQSNVFFFKVAISGTVYDTDDVTNTSDLDAAGVPGATVNLLDSNSNVVASTTTDSQGNYSFTDQTGIPGTGNFSVSVVVPAGFKAVTSTSIPVALTRGGLNFDNVNFGIDETPTVDFSNGFANPAGLQLNGSAQINGSALELTDGGKGEAGSAFTVGSRNVSTFTTSFEFQLLNPNADGFTFTLQSNNPSQLGGGGGNLGYGGIPNSIAIKFDLYNNAGEGINSTGLFINGASPTNSGSIDLTGSGINLHSGDIFAVNLVYDGTTLTETIVDTLTGASFTTKYTVNITSILGGTNAYAGFTAGTGALTATENILSWKFTGA